ncbi:MAG: HAD hydrolase-like protein [Coriobacteriia bacterium]|nr:HAD hydrolase-like protein [Coriobacteriia bacterium]
MSFFKPDEFLSSVEVINPAELVEQGITTVLLDIDNTLVPRGTAAPPAAVVTWVTALKEQGLQICLISNNWHKVVFDHAKTFGLPLVYKAMKPAPFAFLRALRKAQGSSDMPRPHSSRWSLWSRAARRNTVVIGDQLLTDIFGARLLGMRAIMVLPQAKKDLKHTLILRRIEKLFLGDMKPER